jgi:flagellar biosynthesis/type III secretory pathway protein FliH
MKYTVSINEKSKTITVTLADGTKGVAKCCDTDQFNLSTGIELALERAKVAKANAEKPKVAKSSDVMELVKALEKALPAGQMVLVGNGKELTTAQKEWLHNLTDCKGQTKPTKCKRGGTCYTDEEIEEMLDKAHSDGYEEGYADGSADADECCECCDNCDLEYKQSDLDDAREEGYDEGYADGKSDAISHIREMIDDAIEE